MARKKKRKIVDDIFGLTTVGFTAGIGSSAVGNLGGITGANAATGLGNTTTFLPVAGTALGAGLILGQVRRLDTRKKKRSTKKRKKRR